MIRLVALLLFLALAAPAAETIRVENRFYREIGDRTAFLSGTFSRVEDTTVRYFRDPAIRDRMTAILKENGFRSFRFHHEQLSHWRDPFTEWGPLTRNPYTKQPYRDAIGDQEFIRYLHANGFKTVLQINIGTFYDSESKQLIRLDEHPEYLDRAARYQAELVKWVMDNGFGKTILYWELGNESYGGNRTPQEVAAVDSAFIKAIRQVSPDVKIAVDGQSPEHPRKIRCGEWQGTVGQWHREFLTELVRLGHGDSDINFLSQHCYAHWIDDLPFDYPERQPPAVEAAWKLFKPAVITQIGSVEANLELLKSLGLHRTRIQANEFKRGASRVWYSRTLMHALAQTDPLFYFINHPGVDGAVIHCLFNNGHFAFDPAPWKRRSLGWGIFIPTPENGFIGGPIPRLYQLTERLLADGDKILKISGGSAAVAAHGGNRLKFIVVNKEDQPLEADIELAGFRVPEGSKLTVTTLTSERLTDFPVDPFTKARNEFPLREEKRTVAGSRFRAELPKYSIALFELEGVQMTEAQRIPFVHHALKAAESDAKDFYDTDAPGLVKGEKTLLWLDFSKNSPEKAYPQFTFNNGGARSTPDGLEFDGKSRLTVGRLPLSGDTFELGVLFRPGEGIRSGMAASMNFHLTGIGIRGGVLYAGLKTSGGRFQWSDGATYPAGKWLLMTLRYDGKEVELRLNGNLIAKEALTGKVVTTPLTVGADARPAPEAFFTGTVKQIALSR